MTARRSKDPDGQHPRHSPPSEPLRPGMMLNSVIVGPPITGLVGTWSDDGSRLWRLEDPHVTGLIGRGLLARTEIEPDRYREAGWLSSGGGPLLQRRRAAPDGSVEAATASLTPAGTEDLTRVGRDRAWEEFARWL